MDAINKPIIGTQGSAIFIAGIQSLWDIRQATKQALLDAPQVQRYVITREELYYPNALDLLLCDPQQLQEAAFQLADKITGTEDERLRCALLWERPYRGVLLHRHGNALQLAFYPPLTFQQAEKEHDAAMRLSAMAFEAQDIMVRLDRAICSGEHRLSDVLESISEQMDI